MSSVTLARPPYVPCPLLEPKCNSVIALGLCCLPSLSAPLRQDPGLAEQLAQKLRVEFICSYKWEAVSGKMESYPLSENQDQLPKGGNGQQNNTHPTALPGGGQDGGLVLPGLERWHSS